MARRTRISPDTFDLPVERIRAGHFTDAYFNHAKEALEREDRHPEVVMQVFQRHEALLGGIDEAVAILRLCSGRRAGGGWEPGWGALEVRALHEGDRVEPWETVMTIAGDYSLFAHLETVYLGCLARRTLIARNVDELVAAAGGKPLLYFAARHDHFRNQPGDGWAAHLGGVLGVSTDAQAAWWEGRGIGTVPHALIAAHDGDTVSAARSFAHHFARDMSVTVLVDFENDSARTAVEVADALGEDLWGVRLDTAGTLVDRGLERLGTGAPAGVSVELARLVRDALDQAGHEHVRIVVSGGFDARKVAAFEAQGAPVDVYGVGSALLRGENDFTADLVRVDGRPRAKVGREERPNPRLEPVA